jgi:hypothetical protein
MYLKFKTKSLAFIFGLVSVISIPACMTSTTPATAPVTTPSNTIQPTNTQNPTSTEDLAAQKQNILDQAAQDIADFNLLVEQEKLLGNIEISQNSQTSESFFRFTGESDKKIRAAHDNLIYQIGILDKEFLILYKQDYNPTPFPTFNNKEEVLDFYNQALQENQNWMSEQLEANNALKIYDPDLGAYISTLNLEQFAWLGLHIDALNKLRVDTLLTPDLQEKHVTMLRKLDDASVEKVEITSLPFYRNDLTLFQYQTKNNYYILNSDGVIIQITPIQMPLSDIFTPKAPLTLKQLNDKAQSLVSLLVPSIDLNTLTSANGSKIGSFFFRWEDKTKPFLDDGRNYPFIQVGFNQDGELLNYYNTLPLSR